MFGDIQLSKTVNAEFKARCEKPGKDNDSQPLGHPPIELRQESENLVVKSNLIYF